MRHSLFYEKAVVVSPVAHKHWSIQARDTYDFARVANCVPLMAAEFPKAAGDYAIVFMETDGNISPAVLLGLRSGQNSFISTKGRRLGRYVPVFVCRYPFIFRDMTKTITSCFVWMRATATSTRTDKASRYFRMLANPQHS